MQSALYAVNDDGSVELHIHAQPGAGRTQITGRHGDALKVRVAVPPEHGRANQVVPTTLADAFGLSAGGVTLVSGEKDHAKRFRLAVDDVEVFAARLDDLVGAGPARHGPADPD